MNDMLLLDRRTQTLVEESLPEQDILNDLVCFFTVFADGTRIRIVSALAVSELCVTDLARVLKMNQTTLSHQLRFLKGNGIVKTERHGKIVFYRLANGIVNQMLLYGIEFLGY